MICNSYLITCYNYKFTISRDIITIALSSLFKDSKILMLQLPKSGKGRNKKMELEKEKQMQFLLDPSKKVAGESISDGNILNCNNNVRLQRSRRDAKELWKQAKLMGVTDRENEEEIIQRLEDMENRDRVRRKMVSEQKKMGCG